MNIKLFEQKDQHRDLPAADLGKEIDTLVTQGCLLKMIKTHFLSQIQQIHQRKIKKINLMILTTIQMMKQVKLKMFLYRPRRV